MAKARFSETSAATNQSTRRIYPKEYHHTFNLPILINNRKAYSSRVTVGSLFCNSFDFDVILSGTEPSAPTPSKEHTYNNAQKLKHPQPDKKFATFCGNKVHHRIHKSPPQNP
jgi:hypothetical protein